jgi:hypothetical protein
VVKVRADAVRIALKKYVFRFERAVTFVAQNSNLKVRYRKGQRRSARSSNGRPSSADDEVVTHTIAPPVLMTKMLPTLSISRKTWRSQSFYQQKYDAEFEETDIDDCEATHFLAMRAKKKWKNGLDSLRKSYRPDGDVFGEK